MKPTIFLQDACLKHRYIRDADLSAVVERPERLRALCLGIACAGARLELLSNNGKPTEDDLDAALSEALQTLDINAPKSMLTPALHIVRSTASLNLLDHPAVAFAHDRAHIERTIALARDSQATTAKGECEIPAGLAKGDLYLCPESIDAMQGAAGTVCEAVDFVMSATNDPRRAFVGIRPPGHHCGDESPSGFCWINNVAIGAAHAHLEHKVKKVVIFDIDLHHGNGTQAIAWSINEDTYRQKLELEAGAQVQNIGPQIFYGSLHDILSYPCESGDVALVQAASVSIHGAHGQHIENIHLEPYSSEEHFYDILYKEKYSHLLTKARNFIEKDEHNGPQDTLFFISCGFDACEHEYKSMSRHGRKVPVSFYQKFAQDVCALADSFAPKPGAGKVISVLEGGYSDRAILSGTIAHITGLSEAVPLPEAPIVDMSSWWEPDNLTKLEEAMKKRRSPASNDPNEAWLNTAMSLFYQLAGRKPKPTAPASTMKLRERKLLSPTRSGTVTPTDKRSGPRFKEETDLVADGELPSLQTVPESTSMKKLPKVILRLGPRPSLESDKKEL